MGTLCLTDVMLQEVSAYQSVEYVSNQTNIKGLI